MPVQRGLISFPTSRHEVIPLGLGTQVERSSASQRYVKQSFKNKERSQTPARRCYSDGEFGNEKKVLNM